VSMIYSGMWNGKKHKRMGELPTHLQRFGKNTTEN